MQGEDEVEKTYIAIDLKSFYASCELVDRKKNPLTTNLVVADPTRTEKTICLAVSPSLKEYGIPGRARLFEVVQKVKEVNAQRMAKARSLGLLIKDPETGKECFRAASEDAEALQADPSLELAYIIAPPRMKKYEEISTRIFSIYLRYVSEEDIHVYSIDECFIDVTGYLDTYGLTAHELAMKMIRDVLCETEITATAGIGTNMYLAKVAMDVVAKHVPADKDGVRIAELNEQSYREQLWCHQPLTDFWRLGGGIARRLKHLGIFTMGDVARQSVVDESVLYSEFGINAELLIDHAWGWEPTDIATIKSYKPSANSLSSGQVLTEPYTAEDGALIVREMTELLVLDLVRKGLVTKKIELTVIYDVTSLVYERKGPDPEHSTFKIYGTGERYHGRVNVDRYGRLQPYPAHGTGNLDRYTSSTHRITEAMMELYESIVDKALLVRKVYVVACGLIPENEIPEEAPFQMDLFTDYDALEKKRREEEEADRKERSLQMATLAMQEKYGKNAVLKGMNLKKGAMTMKRNKQIGGHASGEE